MKIKQIGLSTSAFGYSMGATGRETERRNQAPWTIDEFVDFAYSNGLGGIEAPLMRFLPNLEADRLKKLRSKLAERGMFFLVDAEAALDLEQIAALIPVAKESGSPIIRIKTSDVLGCARSKLGRPWSEHIDKCISTLKKIAPKLRGSGLRVAIENHQDLDSNDLLRVVNEVGDDVVGVNFDIGNAFSVCEEPMSFADKLGKSIINIHIKDYKIFRSDDGFRLVRCAIGDGAVDFRTILPFLAKNSPNAKMVIELGALEARNIAWLSSDFWAEIKPRDHAELVVFFRTLERNTIRVADDSWKTPWENKLSADEIISYETAQLKTSTIFLSKL